MDIKVGTEDTGDSKKGREGGREERVEKLGIGYYSQYLSDGFSRSLNPSIMQYNHVTHLHMYLLNLIYILDYIYIYINCSDQ